MLRYYRAWGANTLIGGNDRALALHCKAIHLQHLKRSIRGDI